jgi:hypothetical protein
MSRVSSFALTKRLLVLIVPCLILGTEPASAQTRVPPVPPLLEVGDGFSLFYSTHAIGTQNYMCLPAGAAFAWRPIGPQATLFQTFFGFRQQVGTHFLSANPDEGGVARATWQHSLDTSRVWAKVLQPSSDPAYVEPNAIPWLLLERAGFQNGPEGGSFLTQTRYIQRLNTSGGLAPATGCAQATDLGVMVLVPYEADYFFYKANRR